MRESNRRDKMSLEEVTGSKEGLSTQLEIEKPLIDLQVWKMLLLWSGQHLHSAHSVTVCIFYIKGHTFSL